MYNNDRNTKFYPGIYIDNDQAFVDKESALFWITKTPIFQPKFPLVEIASTRVRKDWDKEFGKALAEAIATAR